MVELAGLQSGRGCIVVEGACAVMCLSHILRSLISAQCYVLLRNAYVSFLSCQF